MPSRERHRVLSKKGEDLREVKEIHSDSQAFRMNSRVLSESGYDTFQSSSAPHGGPQKMGQGPSQPACRGMLQTT